MSKQQWEGSLAQIIMDIPVPERNDKYQSGFVDAKVVILQALRNTGFDCGPHRHSDGCCHKTVTERCDGCPYK